MARGNTWCRKLMDKAKRNNIRRALGTSKPFRHDVFNGDVVAFYKSGTARPSSDVSKAGAEPRIQFDKQCEDRKNATMLSAKVTRVMGIAGQAWTPRRVVFRGRK